MTPSPWIAPSGQRLPDFIIAGAMKCGTTTLHHILNQHPDVLIPEREIHFFDIDNQKEHPDFVLHHKGLNLAPRVEENPKAFWQWYGDFFSGAKSSQLVGEDSTITIASPKAAERIAMQDKPIKLIILLRQPTRRAYSEYWHRLHSGRMTQTFTKALTGEPSLIRRSLYRRQIERFFNHLPRKQFHFLLFEDLVQQPRVTVGKVCEFLGIDPLQIPEQAYHLQSNPSIVPRSVPLALLQNHLLSLQSYSLYTHRLPHSPQRDREMTPSLYRRIILEFFRRVNPGKTGKPPSMPRSTERKLNSFFQRELDGIDELTGLQATKRWFG